MHEHEKRVCFCLGINQTPSHSFSCILFINDSIFVRTWYKKVRLLFNHFPLSSVNQLLMHRKEEKTTLAYLRQTLSYTHYPRDSPLINDKGKLLLQQTFHFHLNALVESPSPPYGKRTRANSQNAELETIEKPNVPSSFCSLVKEYKNVLTSFSFVQMSCCVLK